MIPQVSVGQIIDPTTFGNAVVDAINGSVERATFTPPLSNIAIGTGGSAANNAIYTYVGEAGVGGRGILSVTGSVTLGASGFSVTGILGTGLPARFNFDPQIVTSAIKIGMGTCNDVSPSAFVPAFGGFAASSFVTWQLFNPGVGTYGAYANTSATIPFTWAAGDILRYGYTCPVVRV